jgi:hypothetical protein
MSGEDQNPSSPLLEAVRRAIEQHPDAAIIYLSLSPTPVDEDFDGEVLSIKWLAWSLCNEHWEEINESQLVFVGAEHTTQEIERDFAAQFPEMQIYVDHEISFDDD